MAQPTTAVGWVAHRYERVQARVLAAVRDLDEEIMSWRPSGTNSIAFNVWHLARWVDQLALIVPLMAPELGVVLGPHRQIWERERLAREWGFPAAGELGYVETGMGKDEDLSPRLPLQVKTVLLDYATRAFAEAQRATAQIDAGALLASGHS